MLTYPLKCTVLHCNHLGNTWKPLVLMTRQFDYHPRANQSVGSSPPAVSRCFPGGYNVKLYILRGRLAWWLLAFLCCVWCLSGFFSTVCFNDINLALVNTNTACDIHWIVCVTIVIVSESKFFFIFSCPIPLHITSSGNRTPDLLTMSPMRYPLGYMLPVFFANLTKTESDVLEWLCQRSYNHKYVTIYLYFLLHVFGKVEHFDYIDTKETSKVHVCESH